MVAYASEHGSTKAIAKRIANNLSSHGLDAKSSPVNELTDLSTYKYLVVGSAIHAMHWLPAAKQFLLQHRTYLTTVPVWTFSVGYPDGLPKIFGGGEAHAEDEEKKLARHVGEMAIPREHKLFSGALKKEDLGRAFGWMYGLFGGHFGENLDFKKVDEWADQIATHVKDAGN